MRGLKYLFTVPEGEKITEKHLTRVLVSSICSILLCMSCLVSTTWAWFAVSVENTGNVINIGTYSVTTTVTRVSDGEQIQPTSLYQHGYYLTEGEYSVKVELQEGSVGGYCEVYVGGELLGTLVLGQKTKMRTVQLPSTELVIKVNEAVPVMTMSGQGEAEPMPNLVIVPTWGRTAEEEVLDSHMIQIGEEQPRTYAVVINNEQSSLPFYGVSQADIFFEMLIDVDSAATRGLALYRNIGTVSTIGSIRSVRYNFTDLARAYGAVLVHASGSDPVMQDLYGAGVDHFDAEDVGYRDYERFEGYPWEHCLFATGVGLQESGANAYYDEVPQKDNGLTYGATGNTDGGANATTIDISFGSEEIKKTTMVYNNGAYEFHQYGQVMTDESTVSTVAFTNVIVMYAPTTVDADGYYIAQLTGEGTGHFAYGGKIVEMNWSRANDAAPFIFTLADGSPVVLGEGSTYVAIVPANSPVSAQ